MSNPPTSSPRIVSLDQFRGYTVLGMFVVNFVGSFDVIKAHWPLLRHHNTYCSYADTIMPHFLFAVGFAFRLTLLRRIQAGHTREAYLHAVRRNLGLFLLAVVIYHLDGSFKTWSDLQAKLAEQGFWAFLGHAFWRVPFQTLAHIAVTSLWVLPVIAARPSVRIAYMLGSAALHVWLSHLFYYPLVMGFPDPDGRATSPAGIDGGVLGFLT
jgi:predicted acyltransferase